MILVIEDEYDVQGIVEDALIEGGFTADVLSSGEEALTLFRGRLKNYKALVTDVALKGRLNGWEVAAQIKETHPWISRHLHERRALRRMGVRGCAQYVGKAIRASAACDCRCSAYQCSPPAQEAP